MPATSWVSHVLRWPAAPVLKSPTHSPHLTDSHAVATISAEETVTSYALGTEFLRNNADQFSVNDFIALQAVMTEEELGDASNLHSDGIINPNGVILPDDNAQDPDASWELSYNALLHLVERLGNVRFESWARIATARIAEHCGWKAHLLLKQGWPRGR